MAAVDLKGGERLLELQRLGATDNEMIAFSERERSFDEYMFCWIVLFRLDRFGVIAARKRKRSEWKKNNSTPHHRILDATRARIWASLKGRTDGAIFSRLKYTIEDLVHHLEKKFTDGMSMDNYGEWHIDHIRPCSSFDLAIEKDFQECWSLQNLQPLWASDNCKKGSYYVKA